METLIKSFSLLLFVWINCHTHAQGVLSLPETNILYRNYDNIIEIGTGGYKKQVVPVSKSLEITANPDSTYSVKTSGGLKEAMIYIVTADLRDTLESKKYYIRNLPPPELFLGQTENNGFIDLDNLELSANYHNSFGPSSIEFSVLSYEILWEGLDHRLIGAGNILTEEAIIELKALQLTLAPDQSIPITFQTSVKGPDGITRKKAGIFFLR